MRSVTALLIVLSLALPAFGFAQTTAGSKGNQGSTADQPVDVDRLPLNLNRIHRQLKHAQDLELREGLNLRYVIQIYGAAPPLELFSEDDNLATGPVPYGAPTHRELFDQVTPQEFRAPAADFSALIRWLAERNKKKQQ